MLVRHSDRSVVIVGAFRHVLVAKISLATMCEKDQLLGSGAGL